MRGDESLRFKLDRWKREASQLATCTDCYGVGQDMRADDSRACPTCAGSGKAVREPHVLELVDLVDQLHRLLARSKQLTTDDSEEARMVLAELRP